VPASSARPPGRVELGRIVKPHGLKGELVVSGVRISAEELLAVRDVEALGASGERQPLTIVATRPFMQSVLVRFQGVDDVDQARLLHGQVLEVDPTRLPPAEDGTVYLFQLMGLSVVTEDGESLGTVKDVFQTGATPILVVRGTRERMIPMSPDMLVNVDTAGGKVTVRLLPGMEEV
jgi:16S rRNA processing protein RimM